MTSPKDGRKRREAPTSPVDRLPPHSPEAEQGILGCILLDPQILVGVITDLLSEEVFYDLRHRTIYTALVGLLDACMPLEMISLITWLKDRSQLEAVGGAAYLGALPDVTPSAANYQHYLTILNEKYQLRQLLVAATEIACDIYSEEALPLADQLDVAEHKILKVATRTIGKGSVSARVLVGLAMERLLEMEQLGSLTGLPSGFADMDKLMCGFHPAEMIVVAARPSVGKSSLILNIADHLAVNHKVGVGILSLEMPAARMMERMLSARARVDLRGLSAKNPQDAERLQAASKKLKAAPIHINDEPGMSIIQARAKIRRMVKEHGIKLGIIDYLQLLSGGDTGRYEGRQQEVASISKGIQMLTRELDIPIIVLSQMNRDLDKEKNRRPRLSDLKESGAIEQDADSVLLLWNKDTEGSGDTMVVNVDVAKARYGPQGAFSLVFLKKYTRFEDAARDQEVPSQSSFYPD